MDGRTDRQMDRHTDTKTDTQTDTQTDMTEDITYPHTRVVNISIRNYCKYVHFFVKIYSVCEGDGEQCYDSTNVLFVYSFTSNLRGGPSYGN